MKVPVSVLTDSYKASHHLQYPGAKKMVAYGEFRSGFQKDKEDTRILFYGIRYIVEEYISKQWTMQDVDQVDQFCKSHMAPGFREFPFPRELFEKFIKENKGYFPVTIEALPEGTAIHPRVPVYQITTSGVYAPLCTFLETLLTMVWYPTTVATLSRRARDVVEATFEKTVVKGKDHPAVESRLHDFGFRGCTSVEQSVIGGCAHLLNFRGTDTMSAAYYAQFQLNGGRPVGMSVPATEHSVMTAWDTEKQAIENMIEKFGAGMFSVVMDSYDYAKALASVLPSVASKQVGKGGYMVLRPDSGDPVEAVLMALKAADRVFGSSTNKCGYKVIKGCGVLQGDGISIDVMATISAAVEAAGYSAENVVYGMGGGLLQKVNRDTMSFATKLCHLVTTNGKAVDVMKQPATDAGKFSLPGVMAIKRVNGVPTVYPKETGEVADEENLLKVVYDRGPVPGFKWDDFDTVRARAAAEWDALPPTGNMLSYSLKDKINQQMKDRGKNNIFRTNGLT
uniref:Nicotinamide phosphoribosyltransferase n=1 Tax=Chlamydomonas euryale TaxID=1486919 RepID=A0A7R9YV39_9CHLO